MKGVLVINLGSPDSCEVKDVKKYLGEFLMDERVIDMAYWKRFLLVKGIILNTRPKKSAEAYKKIWWKEGSPLVVLSERFTEKLKSKNDLPIELAMRYGSMSIEKGLANLAEKGCNQIFVLPMYPQYAMSSYETVVERVKEVQQANHKGMGLDFLPAFYNKETYLDTLANHMKTQLEILDYDHLLFSYHGIPERHIYKTDPTKSHCKIDGSCCLANNEEAHSKCYRHQCYSVTYAIADRLNIPKDKYSVSFQSRLLKDPWLKPYTDFELEKFPKENKKKLAVVAPAFVTDCLETLEEIAMEGKEEFMEAGGTDYTYIKCLNDSEAWVDTVSGWIDHWAKTVS